MQRLQFCCCFDISSIDGKSLIQDRINYSSYKPNPSAFVAMHVRLASVHEDQFVVQDKSCCKKCFMEYYGIARSTFYRIHRQVKVHNKRNFSRKTVVKDMKDSTVNAISWLDAYSRLYGDFQPDFEEIHLPDYKYRYLHIKYRTEMTRRKLVHIPYQSFLAVIHKKLTHIRLRRYKRFAQCTTCSDFDDKIEQATTDTEKRFYSRKKQVHLDWQQKERLKYHKHVQKSWSNPEKYLSISIDGMDHQKTSLPAFRRETKATGSQEKLDVHVTGVLIHGHYPHAAAYEWTDNHLSDSNMTIHVLLDTIRQVFEHKRENGIPLPSVLYLQMDNCTRENKNKYLMSVLHLLVYAGVFKKIKLSFLPVGHTHEDVDQMFSRFATKLRGQHVMSLPDLMRAIKDAFQPPPITIRVKEVACWNKFLEPRLLKVKGIMAPRVFIVKADSSGVVRHWYKMEMQVRKKVDPSCTLPLNSPGLRMFRQDSWPDLQTLSTSVPLAPTKSLRLDALKETVKFLDKHDWIADSAKEWWKSFIQEQDDMELDRCHECRRLRAEMVLCRRDIKDLKDVARDKARRLRKFDKELGRHILEDTDIHDPAGVVFPPGDSVIAAKLREANSEPESDFEVGTGASSNLNEQAASSSQADGNIAEDGEEDGDEEQSEVGNNATSDSDADRDADVSMGIAGADHVSGALNSLASKDLPKMKIGDIVILNPDLSGEGVKDDAYLSCRPIWVGKVLSFEANGHFTYQTFGRPINVWKDARYFPGWLDRSDCKNDNDPPKEIYVKHGRGRKPLTAKAHSSASFWWFSSLNSRGTIPNAVKKVVMAHPRYKKNVAGLSIK